MDSAGPMPVRRDRSTAPRSSKAQSMSKPVFAYVVMKLSEDGALDLDTPLTTYSRERLLVNDSRLDRITARHVLSHTSGLQNWRSASEPLSIHFTPGERWLYSGEGYSLPAVGRHAPAGSHAR